MENSKKADMPTEKKVWTRPVLEVLEVKRTEFHGGGSGHFSHGNGLGWGHLRGGILES